MSIFDAGRSRGDLSLDREGFALVRHPTRVKDFYNDKEIRNVYYPAVEAFLRATSNADRVFIFDHPVRRRVEGADDVRGGGAAAACHPHPCRSNRVSGHNRVYKHLPEEADELAKGRCR